MPSHAGSGLRLGCCAILLRGTERITVIRIPKRVAVIGSIRRCWRHVGTALRSGLHEWIAVIRLRVLLIVLLISTHIRIPEERIATLLRLLRSLPVRAILRLRGYVRRTIRSIVRGCGAISRLRRHGTVRTIFRCRTVLLGRRILIRSCANYPGLDSSFYRICVKLRQDNEQLIREMARVLERRKPCPNIQSQS